MLRQQLDVERAKIIPGCLTVGGGLHRGHLWCCAVSAPDPSHEWLGYFRGVPDGTTAGRQEPNVGLAKVYESKKTISRPDIIVYRPLRSKCLRPKP